VETLTAQIVSKLLHEPTVRVKEAPAGHAEALRSLFALDEERV
jgi:glutamyl-tRNA reductase